MNKFQIISPMSKFIKNKMAINLVVLKLIPKEELTQNKIKT